MWIDGSKEQIDALKKEAVETGEMIKLNEDLLPDCYLHRTAENDVARVEDRTLICSREEKDAGPTNHWMEPSKAYKMLYDIARGSYQGRTMYIIPYSMGPVGSPFSKIGVEITDSIYVVLNMNIMTRIGKRFLTLSAIPMIGFAVCTANVMLIPKRDGSASSPRTTLSSPLTPLTAATYSSVKSALLFV